MTYHPLGATAEELRARLTAFDPTKREALVRQYEAGVIARLPKPDDIVQIPRECRMLRIASFEAFEDHLPPTIITPKSGLLMFTMKVNEDELPKDMGSRAEALLLILYQIKNRLRPAITNWDRNDNWKDVLTQLRLSGLANTGKIVEPDNDTAWALNWNKSGPIQKQPRNITSINSIPDKLFERLLAVQTDAWAADSLSWLHSVQPGPGGILPKEGFIWYTIEVLKNPSRRNPSAPRDAKGRDLLRNAFPFETDDLIGWGTRVASATLRDTWMGSLAMPVASWIPGITIDEFGPQNPYAVSRQVALTGKHHAGDWRSETTRRMYAGWEDKRLMMAGYFPMFHDRVFESAKSAKQLPVVLVDMTIGDARHLYREALRRTSPGGVTVVGDGRLGSAAVISVGVPDRAFVLTYPRLVRDTEYIPPVQINRMYDLASVLGTTVVDMLVAFLSQSLIGPKTDRKIRREFNLILKKIEDWLRIETYLAEASENVASARASADLALRIMKDEPQRAMDIVNSAIKKVQLKASKLQQHADAFSAGGWATADLDASIERSAQQAQVQVRRGLNDALDMVNRRMSGATESQKLFSRCLLFKKANHEGRQWPDRLRATIPILENARRTAVASMWRVPGALAAYDDVLKRLIFIKNQIPLPWWQRRAGLLPIWGWGALGVTGFLGGAVALRQRRKKRLGKAIKKNRLILARRTSH